MAERALRHAAVIPNRSIRLLACGEISLTAARKRWAFGQTAPDGASWLVTSPEAYLELLSIPLRQLGCEVELVVSNGKPERCIVDEATDAEIVVMTTRHGMTRHLIGGTADHVVRNAPVPVVLIRDGHPVGAVAVLRIVVPLDGSEYAAEAFPLAAIMRHSLGVGLHLIRVVDPATSLLATTDQAERQAAAYLESQLARLDDTAGATTYDVPIGRPDERILETLRPGDLVVMATRGYGELGRRLMGSVSTAVAERALVPVVLVRAAPGQAAPLFSRGVERGQPAD
jgi:nucleotide-binding universal stress UspA family protein